MAGGLLPSLLLIGARKCGTTALSNQLREHPSLVFPDCYTGRKQWPPRVQRLMCVWNKEVRYFSRGLNVVDACWYRRLYPCSASAEPEHSKAGAGLVAFDGSPDYLVIPDANIAAMYLQLGPRARLVAMLRNPSDRFYSAYNMGMNEKRRPSEKATYTEFSGSLDRLIACAPKECPEEPNVVMLFFNYGMYARHLQRFITHFGREALLIECSEEYYATPLPTVQRVLAHAGLAMSPALESSLLASASNRSQHKSNAGARWGGTGYKGHLAQTERAKLDAFYRPYNAELYALMGRDLRWERAGSLVENAAMDPAANNTVGGSKEMRMRPARAEL